MDALEFLKCVKKICERGFVDYSCEGCPLEKSETCVKSNSDMTENGMKEGIAIVEKWAKEHPRKTYKMDFLEKFPNAKLNVFICKNSVYRNSDKCSNICCKDCWNEEMEE